MGVKHTPGPWFDVSDDPKDRPLIGARSALVNTHAGTACICCTGSGQNFAEDAANARLIAAAPDLLAALQDLDTRLRECMSDPISAAEAYDSCYQDIVAEALKKATGETA